MMRKRWLGVMLVVLLTCFASFYICEAGANTEAEEMPEEVERPEWNTGDYWEYKVTNIMKGGKKKRGYTMLWKVLKKGEMFEGIECYISVEGSLRGYYTLDLNMKGFINEIRGVIFDRAKITPDTMEYSWPLEVGKKWEQSYIILVESRERGKGELKENKFPVNATYEVVGVEKVAVPAGEFLALKIVRKVGDVISEECWYSPRAKWFVKKMVYSQSDDQAELWELMKGEY